MIFSLFNGVFIEERNLDDANTNFKTPRQVKYGFFNFYSHSTAIVLSCVNNLQNTDAYQQQI